MKAFAINKVKISHIGVIFQTYDIFFSTKRRKKDKQVKFRSPLHTNVPSDGIVGDGIKGDSVSK